MLRVLETGSTASVVPWEMNTRGFPRRSGVCMKPGENATTLSNKSPFVRPSDSARLHRHAVEDVVEHVVQMDHIRPEATHRDVPRLSIRLRQHQDEPMLVGKTREPGHFARRPPGAVQQHDDRHRLVAPVAARHVDARRSATCIADGGRADREAGGWRMRAGLDTRVAGPGIVRIRQTAGTEERA